VLVEREIIVRGEAEVRAMPDKAVLRVLVEGTGSNQEKAYEAAARLASAVDGVFGAQAASIGRVTTAALVVQPRTRWQKGETVRTGWRAQRMSVVEIRAVDRVGDISAMLVGAGASLTGPSWELDTSNDAHHQARVEAAQDARRRAEAFALALGVDLGPLTWVSEPGLRLAGSGGPAFTPAARVGYMSVSAPDETIEVAPAEMTVHAAVEVGFHIAD
jgi:uncharacterized protein YggE